MFVFFFAESVGNHFPADESQQAEGDPMVVGPHGFAEIVDAEPSQKRHEPLEQTEKQCHAQEVAAALGTRCVLPEHAEIGNAIGAVMAELIARASIPLTQWDEGGLVWLVHTPSGSVKFKDVEEATALAREAAAAEAVKEARLRGAQGELHPVITQQGNTHDGRSTERLTYGGTVTAEVRYSYVK